MRQYLRNAGRSVEEINAMTWPDVHAAFSTGQKQMLVTLGAVNTATNTVQKLGVVDAASKESLFDSGHDVSKGTWCDPMPLNLLTRLQGVKTTGNGWIAKCPGHQDRQASLSVTTGEDGRVLLKCFAGCSPQAITGALGMKLADLWPVESCRAVTQQSSSRADRLPGT